MNFFQKSAGADRRAGSQALAVLAVFGGLLFFLSSCQSFSVPEARIIPEDYFGMSPGGGEGPADREYALLDELGAVWLRKTFNWNKFEPEMGVWDYSEHDEFVEASNAAGKKVIAILAYDTYWIHGGSKRRWFITPEQLPYYLRYVETLVRRYKGKIGAWEIWNEPNWIFWKGKKADFYVLARAAAEKIREIDPEAKIVAGSFNRVPGSFIRGLFRAGAMEQADSISFHPYDISPQGSVWLYDRFKKSLASQGYTGEIWVTEVGYPTGGWYPTRVREARFPAYIVKTLAGLAVRGAGLCCWYELFDAYNRDENHSPHDSEHFFGLVYPDYSPKKGAAAYALCSRYIAGYEYRPEFPERDRVPAPVESLYFRGKDKRHTLILWNRGIFPVRLGISLPGTGQRLYDIVSGDGQDMAEHTELLIGDNPRIITWISGENEDPPKLYR
ncbi:MAG: hypothetical protein LBK02_05745 [Treponema sp.]|jgi:hypothetical protein|nr:hypothetical protein [Treponema sp.]